MDRAFYSDYFSHPFNVLRYLGCWPNNSEISVNKKFFKFYTICITVLEWHIVALGLIDLYIHLDNFKRVIYNLCVTSFSMVITVKNYHFTKKADRINKIRLKLFLLSFSQNEEEEIEIKQQCRRILRIHKTIFYFCFAVFFPIWLLSSLISLKWGPRELPFPVWIPVDVEDNSQFALGFFYHTLIATFLVTKAIHAELAMFSLIILTTGQYKIMGKNIMKLNDFYNGSFELDKEGNRKKDINKFLTRWRVKKELRSLVKRQLELKEYVQEVEYCLFMPMLYQMFGGLILSVLNGLELMQATMDFSFRLSYQIAYTIVVLSDLFMCCFLSDGLLEESRKINTVLYSLLWYEMDNDIQKDILLMIVGAQRIHPLTVGKFFALNLSTYLGLIKNLYSWLALFRTVVTKK